MLKQTVMSELDNLVDQWGTMRDAVAALRRSGELTVDQALTLGVMIASDAEPVDVRRKLVEIVVEYR